VPKFNETLKTYLFTTGDITKIEEAVDSGSAQSSPQVDLSNKRTTIGDMKGN
jgi:hypothetical protein